MAYVSMKELIEKFSKIPGLANKEIEKQIKKSAQEVRDTAVKKFGTKQPSVGPYPEWELLTTQTLHRKMDLGGATSEDYLIGHYPDGERNELWPTHLRNSISYKVEGLDAAVGTDDPIGKWQEHGTPESSPGSIIPPRPFLRPALYENQDQIVESVKTGLQKAMKKLI